MLVPRGDSPAPRLSLPSRRRPPARYGDRGPWERIERLRAQPAATGPRWMPAPQVSTGQSDRYNSSKYHVSQSSGEEAGRSTAA